MSEYTPQEYPDNVTPIRPGVEIPAEQNDTDLDEEPTIDETVESTSAEDSSGDDISDDGTRLYHRDGSRVQAGELDKYFSGQKEAKKERSDAFGKEAKTLWDIVREQSEPVMITKFVDGTTGAMEALTQEEAKEQGKGFLPAAARRKVEIPNPKDTVNPGSADIYVFRKDRVPRGSADIWIQEYDSDGNRADMYAVHYKEGSIVHYAMSEDGAQAVWVGRRTEPDEIQGFADKYTGTEV